MIGFFFSFGLLRCETVILIFRPPEDKTPHKEYFKVGVRVIGESGVRLIGDGRFRFRTLEPCRRPTCRSTLSAIRLRQDELVLVFSWCVDGERGV